MFELIEVFVKTNIIEYLDLCLVVIAISIALEKLILFFWMLIGEKIAEQKYDQGICSKDAKVECMDINHHHMEELKNLGPFALSRGLVVGFVCTGFKEEY